MKPAYGYIFSKENIKIGFTGDTTICKNVEYMASIFNYLFYDCTSIDGNSKHMGIDMLKKFCIKYKKCKFVVSHLEDITSEKLKSLKITNIIIPEDGLKITID